MKNYLSDHDEEKRSVKWSQRKKTQMIAIIFLLVLVIGYALLNSGESFTINLEGDTLMFSYPEMTSVSVNLSDLESISLRSEFDTGEYVSGVDSFRYLFGTWRNDELGEYSLCAHSHVRTFIILKTHNGFVVFNEGSPAGTADFYYAFITLLEQEGYIAPQN